jgi:methyltransferase (TIGR00027 family)
MAPPVIRDICDTARWVAFHRATESLRIDPVIRDPYAQRLAGERGEAIGRRLHQNQWAIAFRTLVFDTGIVDLLARESFDTVINLAAGLDSRPFRLALSPSLRWVEIDLPEIVAHKQLLLSGETPRCRLEVSAVNLSDLLDRRQAFTELDRTSKRALVLSEGLLCYLATDQVSELAKDLHHQSRFEYWMVDVMAPKALDWVQRKFGRELAAAGARMQFGPLDWRSFYQSHGWEVIDFTSLIDVAQRFKRAPFLSKIYQGVGTAFPAWYRNWESGVALLRQA